MYYIIETPEQLEKFATYDLTESFVEPIMYSDVYHTAINKVCAYYIKPNRSRTGFILPISHTEAFPLSEEVVIDFIIEKVSKIYTADLKRSRAYLPVSIPAICFKTLKWLETGEVLDDAYWNTPAHSFLYGKYPTKFDINRIVPICKIQEKWNNYLQDNKKLLHSKIENKKYFQFYNTTVNDTLSAIEMQGISIDTEKLSAHYPDVNTLLLTIDSKIYTHYNLNTATGRPSNSFGGVNFGAMNKSDDSREFIVAGNNWLLEFDYNSYHPKILCNLVGYEFEGPDIHSHLGRMYFDTNELSPEQYTESKNITFKLLYTDSGEFNHLEFFRLIKAYKDALWVEYRQKGYIKAIISKRPIFGISSKTQILPYLLQSYETERNILVMNELQNYLSDKSTKLIAYFYDAFLFDYSQKDGKATIKKIQSILDTDGFTTNTKVGENYAKLELVSLD